MRCWSRVYQHVTELTHFCVCAWVSVCMNVSILARANFALLLLLRLYEPWLTRERRRERDRERDSKREGEREKEAQVEAGGTGRGAATGSATVCQISRRCLSKF